MSRSRAIKGRTIGWGAAILASAGILTAAITSTSSTAVKSAGFGENANHYYIEISGTGAGDPAGCDGRYTTGYQGNYTAANDHLNGGKWVAVCYPATIGPFVGNGFRPDPAAPHLDDSVAQGVTNTVKALEEKYHEDPGAHFTIVGYSQGAEVGDMALQRVANGDTAVPKSQVDGKLYADPMQPGTGLWAKNPKGWNIPLVGITSPGPGPENFSGVPVERFCIHSDGICDGASVFPPEAQTAPAIVGYFRQHGRYPNNGDIIPQTIANDVKNGITWYPAS
ncbi:PE-PPE domain-containing protein [Actinoallomurus sp. NPDC050550]|uniref:PE-PPE domain-containing protein n=1 Tax=Actinoallomurus sp. NPDC050550 TaxID=3154937 RepID=UPI0033C5509B